MKGRIGVYTFQERGGAFVEDLTYKLQGGIITTNERGFESLSGFLPYTLIDSFMVLDRPIHHITAVSEGLETAFEGRIEDRAMTDGGIDLTSFGYQSAMSDLPYTALWSDLHYARWRPATDDDRANATPEKWALDNNNRLYLALGNGNSFANGADLGELTYAAPHNGERGIVAFSASYSIDLANNFQLRIIGCNYDFTGATVLHTVTSAGSPASGSINITFSAYDRVIVQVRNNTGSAYNFAGDTGDEYAKLTVVKLRTSTSSTITADLIISDLVSYIYATNPSQINDIASGLNIDGSGAGLDKALYEDEYPASILDTLLDLGKAGTRMQWGVWEDQIVRYGQRGSIGKTWYTDVVGIALNNSIGSVNNSMYGTYTNGYNELERTAVSDSDPSIRAAGVTRRAFVGEQSQSKAEQRRDLLLAERKSPTPKATLKLSGLYDQFGARFPLWCCRGGDSVVIRNLPPSYTPSIDKIRQFYVSYTSYNMDDDTLVPSPELGGVDDLAIIISNNLQGIDPGVALSKKGKGDRYV